MYFIENSFIDPEPFYQTLKWNLKRTKGKHKKHDKNDKEDKEDIVNRNNLLRIPLLLLQFAISNNGYYDSRLRSLLKSITTYCNISWNEEFIVREYSFGVVLHVLLQKKEAKSSTKNYGRWAKIGAVGIVSGVLIAVTGGLAAPAVAAGLGAIGLTATGTFLLTTTGTATLYILFGAAGAGYAGLKMHNTISTIKDFKFIPLKQITNDNNNNTNNHNGLNVIITVHGWLEGMDDDNDNNDNKDDVSDESKDDDKDKSNDDETFDDLDIECRDYWIKILNDNDGINLRSDCYTLQYEKKCLLSLGEGLKKFVAKRAVSGTVSTAAKAGLGYTAFATLVGALTFPVALLAVADWIDNPWSVAFSKSKEAGLVLADCLASGNHGHRPVTLIGYSLGARVIYYALKELVKRYNKPQKDDDEDDKNNNNEEKEESSTFSKFMRRGGGDNDKNKDKDNDNKNKVDLNGIIENVIILGGPLSCDIDEWSGIRKIVSDRIINCYSLNDWVLKFVYRTATVTTSVAGLMPIQCDGIENINLSNCIGGHSEYYQKTPKIINYLIEHCDLLV